MKHLKDNPETLYSINLHLGNIIEIMEENDLYYDWTTIYDIMCHGAFGLVFQLEMDYDELPEGLECECDDLSDELHNFFEGDLDLMEKFVEEFLNEYGI